MKFGVLIVSILSGVLSPCFAHSDTETEKSICDRKSLTNGLWGLDKALEPSGIEMTVSTTQIYQQNLKGGISTHRKAGRYSGSYDIQLSADMEKLIGFSGGSMYMRAEGSWSDGINDPSVGSQFGVNADAAGYRSLDVTELWYEQMLGSESLRLRIGKLDLTGTFECRGCPVSFDGNRFANDENTQFLNSSLVNNPTIPFPDRGLGAVLFWNPIEWWYASAGIADAQADARETGFNTAFHGEDYFFSIAETGITPQIDSPKGPMQGAYRIGMWYDPQDKDAFDGSSTVRDDRGYYLSLDQLVWKENTTEDQQGLGVFARYGWADQNVNTFKNFISGGLSYTGLFDGRDDDVTAVGVGHGSLSDKSEDFTVDSETVFEAFHNAQITKFIYLTPSVQYIARPNGANGNDAVVAALRLQIIF